MKYAKIYLSMICLSLFGSCPAIAIAPVAVVNDQAVNSSAELIAAQNLNQQGLDYLAKGQPQSALVSWQQANKIYTILKDKEGIIGTEINQAQAYQSMGFYRQSFLILKSVKDKLDKEPSSILKVKGLQSLGNTLKSLRIFKTPKDKDNVFNTKIDFNAKIVFDEALKSSLEIKEKESVDQIRLSLANTFELMGETDNAIKKHQEIINSHFSPIISIQAQVNLLRLRLVKDKQFDVLNSLIKIEKELNLIPPNHQTIYAHINLAQTVLNLPDQKVGNDQKLSEKVKGLLDIAIRQASTVKDSRGEAEALGAMGKLDEATKQYPDAQKLTKQALVIAEGLPAPDIAYRLQWQLGRILAATNVKDPSVATKSYAQAISHLKTLRNDLNAGDTELQFTFRDSIEPVYREYVEILLTGKDKEISAENLKNARDLLESLQVAELENYLRQGCLDEYKVTSDRIDRSAAIIYPIVLKDRIAVITSIPQNNSGENLLRYHSRPIPKHDLIESVKQLDTPINEFDKKIRYLREVISTAPPDGKSTKEFELEFMTKQEPVFKSNSKQVYDLLIAPIASDLQQYKIETLVFILDGELRNLPMSVLYDGEKYLFEKYNLALAPGLQLVPPQNNDSNNQYRAFLGGVSDARLDFRGIPSVLTELNFIEDIMIKQKIPIQKLINDSFTQKETTDRIASNSSSIVHISTHGEFNDNPDETFILTWDGLLKLDQFNELLQSRNVQLGKEIDLLVLSACETAKGNNRAALGLAGVAVKARTKSTIASLWLVNDKSTASLMQDFYRNLLSDKTGKSRKAKSLRLAQQSLLKKYRSPYFWAPFVLVGNW
jgi:CHAT domain-containing protein